MFDSLLKLISPAKGLQMLKIGIEKAIGKPIEVFTLVYIDATEQLLFDVVLPDGKHLVEPYTGANKGMIIFTVKNLAKTKLKDGETLDGLKCHHNKDGSLNLEIIITKDGKKEKTIINNYKP